MDTGQGGLDRQEDVQGRRRIGGDVPRASLSAKAAIIATVAPMPFLLYILFSPWQIPYASFVVWPLVLCLVWPIGAGSLVAAAGNVGLPVVIWTALCLDLAFGYIAVAYPIGPWALGFAIPILIAAFVVVRRYRRAAISLLICVLAIYSGSLAAQLIFPPMPVFGNAPLAFAIYLFSPYVPLVYCLWTLLYPYFSFNRGRSLSNIRAAEEKYNALR